MDEGVPGPAITTVSAAASGEDEMNGLEESTVEAPGKDAEQAEVNKTQTTAGRKKLRDKPRKD